MPSLMAMLGLNGSAFSAGLDRAKNEAKEAGAEFSALLGEEALAKLGVLASAAGLEQLIEKTVEYGEKVSITAERLGMSTDAVQAWDYALKLNGSSIDNAAGFFEKLAVSRKKAMEGQEKEIAGYRNLGVSLDDLKNKRLEDIATQIAEAFQLGDPQKLVADLRDVGGKGAGQMVAAFRDGLADLVNEAKGAGVVMGNEVVEGLRDAADRSKTVWMQFTTALAPAIEFMSKMLNGLWRSLQVAGHGAVGLVTGGVKGANDLVGELEAQFKEQDAMAEKRREARKKPLAGGADEEGENGKVKRAHDQEARRQETLQERLAELQNKNYLNSLSKEEQITELHRRRVELATWLAANGGKLSEEGKLKAQIDLETLQGEEDATQRGLDKPKHAKGAHAPSADSLQRIGAYASAPEQASLDLARKSERHLAGIHAGIQALAGHQSKAVGGHVRH